LAAVVTAILASRNAHAFGSPISWGSAQNITGDSDISTLGTLLYAYNIGGPGVAAPTVNGVPFSSFAFPPNFTSQNATVGDMTISENPGFLLSSNSVGSTSGNFSLLSNGYQHLLGTGGFADIPGTITVFLGGLTAGQDYLVQWWSNDSVPTGSFDGTGAGYEFIGFTPEVTLDSNTADAAGGLGQFAIGNFTATGSSLSFQLKGSGSGLALPLINAIQVRNIPSAAVPEPGQVAASILLLAGIGGYVWMKRRNQAKAKAAAV
jgi:hypothetical protein